MGDRTAHAARNIETVRRFYSAGPADDETARSSFFAADAVWHVPGDNPVSGPYRGIDAITREVVGRMQPLDDWQVDLADVMANDDMVVATVRIRGRRRARTIDTPGAHVFRLDDESRIVEAWGFTADQAKLDEFLRA